jgi:hypothetical protein
MSKPLTLDTDPDLYFLMDAAELISVQVGQDHAQRERLAKEMREAVRKGELGAYYFKDGQPLCKIAIGQLVRMVGKNEHCTVESTTPLCVRPAGVNAWLKTTSWGFTWDVQAQAPASKDEKIGPAPVTTLGVAQAFEDLRGWNFERWKKNLSNKPKWLKACMVTEGARGGKRQITWNPVLIGAALHNQGVKQHYIRARFMKKGSPIAHWFQEWKDYETEHLD